MPTTTYEIRWFTIEQPFAIEAVFGADMQPDLRTDWYAPVEHPGTGTKLREGRLETKLLTDVVETVAHAGCAGVMERWQKWSAPLTDAMPPDALLRSTGWTAVHKQRWLQVWSADGSDLELVDRRVGRGSLFELTRISVGPAVWWTVAFEAFGPEGERRPALERVMTHVLEHLPEHRKLDARDSMGYPAWLLRVR